MKLKFKHQAYQTNAVEAVADCFKGQLPSSSFSYKIDPGKSGSAIITVHQSQLFDINGFRNEEISKSINLLENIHK